MFRNYLAATLRNLGHNKLYAAINFVGLTIGFAAALLVALFVRDELSYEGWLPGHENLYRVTAGGPGTKTSTAGPSDLGQWLKLEFPQMEAVTRLFRSRAMLKRGEAEYNETVAWVDPNFLDLFRLPVIAGDPATALSRPDGVVLNRRTAMKYFQRPDPIGETLLFEREHPMQVTAVIEDLPSNTHLAWVDVLATGEAQFSPAAEQDRNPIKVFGQKLWNTQTYFRAPAGTDIQAIRAALPDMLNRRGVPLPGRKSSEIWLLTVMPIDDLHLGTGDPADLRNDYANLYTVAAIGLLIVLAAGINFVNLMTARATRRALEVGVRKAAGAERRDLFVQFMGESFVYVVLSALAATALAAALLPSFNGFLLRTMRFDLWADPLFLPAMLGFIVLTGFLAGAWPSLVLSAFPPALVLKAGTAGGTASRARQALVVLQFAIMIGLLVSTAIFWRQMQFGTREALRQTTDPVLTLQAAGCPDALRDAVRAVPGVQAAACSWQIPQFGIGPGAGANFRDKGTGVRYTSIAPGLFELYGMKPAAGRFFEADRTTDQAPAENVWERPEAVVLNEKAARNLGFETPAAAVGQIISWAHLFRFPNNFSPVHAAEIIGVVEDFQIGQVESDVLPAIFYFDPKLHGTLSIKIAGPQLPEALDAIAGVWKRYSGGRPLQQSFFDQSVQGMYMAITRQAQLFALFAGIAIFIASLGLVGLSAFTAERRTLEIGVRKAMGGKRADIVRLLLWEFSRPVLWANLIAWPAAYYFLGLWLARFARHVDLEAWIFLAAGAVALGIALLTVFAHVFRIAGARPVAALRYQ